MNIVDWIAAFVKQTNLLVEQWTTASVEEGFSGGQKGNAGKRAFLSSNVFTSVTD